MQHGDSYLAVTLPDGSPANLRHRLSCTHPLRGTALRVLHRNRTEAQGRTPPHELERCPRRARPLKITVRSWKGKNGEDMQSNDIKKFLTRLKIHLHLHRTSRRPRPRAHRRHSRSISPRLSSTHSRFSSTLRRPPPANQPTGVFTPESGDSAWKISSLYLSPPPPRRSGQLRWNSDPTRTKRKPPCWVSGS